MATRPATLALPLVALLGAACSSAPSSDGPVPVAMAPSQGTGLAALPVTIAGQRFDAATSTDFEKGSASLDATYSARLIPEAGGATVELEAVRLAARSQLAAQVPAGIARGTYTLEVTAPKGRTGRLPQAFRVVTSAESVATFRVEPAEAAHAGVPFLVALTAVDGTGLVVDGFAGDVTLSDLSGTVTPTAVGPFSFGRLSVRVTVSALAAADRLSAVDALSHAGTSDPFPVQPGPVVALAFAGSPATVAAGSCSAPILLELRDALGNASAATGAVDVALQAAPAGSVTFHTDGSCATPVGGLTISAGATSATFRIRGASAGLVELRAAPTGLPSATQGATIAP
jgi:hypothetical protein